jgi:hydrogenase small subunit
MASFPGFGIESDADKVGMALGAATVAGIAAHAIATNIRKKKLIDNLIVEGKESEKELSE